MKMTDGKKTVEIEIRKWNGSGYDPDWSHDYFAAGTLPYDEELEAYIVDDVDYCIDFASDKGCKDSAVMKFDYDGNVEYDEDMHVFVTELD